MIGYFMQEKVCDDLHGKPTMRIIVKVDREFWDNFKHDHVRLTHNQVKKYISDHAMYGLRKYLFSELTIKKIVIWYTNN